VKGPKSEGFGKHEVFTLCWIPLCPRKIGMTKKDSNEVGLSIGTKREKLLKNN